MLRFTLLLVMHFVYAFKWSAKSTDGNMPEANERQQIES